MSLYSSRTALEQVEAELRGAQIQLNRHSTDLAGRCIACGSIGPCPYRADAVRRFSFYSRLPARLPGASQPERIGSKRIKFQP